MAPLMTYINGAKAGMRAPGQKLQQRQQEAGPAVKIPSVAEAASDKPHISEFEHFMFYVGAPPPPPPHLLLLSIITHQYDAHAYNSHTHTCSRTHVVGGGCQAQANRCVPS